MSKYKVCVYGICKNESRFVKRWMESMKEADLVVVTDTGSSDDTVEQLRALGAEVYVEEVTPWRFDVARNISLDHVPADVDICICTDLDEVFESGWRQLIEEAWDPTHTRGRYTFVWEHHADGSPKKQSPQEKIHRRHGFKWVNPVHETLEYDGKDQQRTVLIPGLVKNHYPDVSKSRAQYLPLLEMSAKENPTAGQTVFWLGREYMYYGKYDDAIKTLKEHLALPTALWNEERCASMRYIAASYEAKGELQMAKSWLFKAVSECPTIREPYYDLVVFGYKQQDWPLVYAMAKKGLAITHSSGSYLVESKCWGYLLDDYLGIACYRLGLYDEGYEHAKKACSYDETNARLKENLKFFEQKVNVYEE